MSTFCRITGRSRGLPKPNYFPLLPPISPADAKRFCRITGKAYGLPTHHFIPVLVGRPKRKSKSHSVPSQRIEGQCLPHGKRHILLSDFRYVSPSFKDAKELNQLLTSKNVECNDKFVYTVDESRCNLVFPAKLEACVRDGDVREIMLAKDLETVLLKLKHGINVSLDIDDIDVTGLVLWEGDGPSEEVIRNRMKRKRTGSTDVVRKIFEDKERAAEVLLEETEKKRPRVKSERMAKNKQAKLEKQAWNNFKEETVSSIVDSNVEKILKVVLAGKDWEQLDKDIDQPQLLISSLPTPLNIESDNVDLGLSTPGIIQQPFMTENFVGFEPIVAVSPVSPLLSGPDKEVLNLIKTVKHEELFKTAEVDKVFNSTTESFELLPTINEIPEVMAHLKDGEKAVQEHIISRNFVNEVHGLKVNIEAGQRFVIGLTIDSPKGPVFVPGQTVNFPIGDTFVPGITVQTPEKQACLLPGLPVKIKDEKNSETEIFVAGQNVVTRDGEKFVQGQTIMTINGMKFVPGQTVFTGNAPRFIPGQIMPGEKLENYRFIPGQTESTQHEAKFIPGQTVLLPNGATQFIAGQCVEEKDGWDFVPGKSVCRAEGGLKFLPGREVRTQDSCVFVPGQYAAGDDGENQFIPGTSLISDYGDLQFILDSNICTPRGEQFVKRISIVPEAVNLGKSVPGIIEQPKFMENIVGFETVFHAALIAPNMNEPDPDILNSIKMLHHDELFKTADIDKVFNLSTKSFELLPKISDIPEIMENIKNGQKGIQDEVITRNFVNEVHGLRVKTKSGEKFVIGHMVDTPSGQTFVPGQTLKSPTGDTFVPGIIVQTSDSRVCLLPGLPIKTRNEKGVEIENFVAGQNVMTPKGEKFVQGQILLTSEGKKFVAGQTLMIDNIPHFVPGQCLMKKGIEDSRFVPGLTETTHHGTNFIPGQIMAMSNGESEFVPGQSIHGDNGWVFVPGKTVQTAEGISRFLPGKETRTEDGITFQPGHYVMADDGSVQFVLGLSVIKSYGDMQFVPTDALNSLKKEVKSIIPENVNLCQCLPGSINQPSINGNFTGLETAFVPKPITPIMNEPDKNIPNALKNLHHEELFKTADVDKVFNSTTKSFELVPSIKEIPDVIANLKCGQKSVQEQVLTRNFVNEVHGLRIETKSGQKFVVGLTVDLPGGTAFIPGQTLKTPKGDKFIPGLIVKTLDNEASFLPGLPIKVKDNNGDEVDYFVAGQYVTINDAEKFIQGQILDTNEGAKFVAGQTVSVGDIPHFVPGQILPKLKLENSRFIPGLTETSQQGEKFVPGQMLTMLSGEVGFVPGQSVNSTSGWVFVPGKTVLTEEGGSKFLPGQDMKTKGEFSQQSGHYVLGNDGSTQFLPGMPDVRNYGDMKFVSTVTMNTIVEEQFVEGISVVSEKVNLSQSLPGLVQQPMLSEKFVGFDPILAAKPITPFLAEPDNNVLSTINKLTHEELFKTAEIEKVFNSTTESFGLLPRVEEIPEIVSQLRNGHRAVQEHALTRNFVNEVHGMRVEIDGGKRFVVGQTVDTQSGQVFIPGQTVKMPTGDTFVPGISVRTPSNEVSLLPGLPIKMKNERNYEVEVFVAGQVAITRDGEKFVQGQALQTSEGVKFVPGQTVIVGDAPHFVAGQTVPGVTLEDSRFIPGQTETSQHGTKFVPGQTVISSGEVEFIPGQSVCGANGWVFVPGKSVCTMGGGTKFLPGKDIKTEDGVTFVSGQYLTGEDGKVDFIPGTFVMKDPEDIKFLPGASMSTPEGEKFVEGQIVKNKQGDFKFLPGKSSLSESGKLEFAPAHKIEEVIFHNKISLGIFSNEYSIYAEMKTNGLYGHMVQTEQGVEFFPGNATGLPAGKVIPGKLIRGEKEDVTFVPGIMLEDDFIPGQLVITDKGEQFIPGQVVETVKGPKFVPGQIINSSSGPKFVPGQTVETADGPKFVPGQIVDTKAGPTFIPGQIIFTEEAGSRFVPGQVVDTVEGPHFVPGRVIETGNHVIFIPGQVVETSEGLKYVAPDLEEGEGGEDCEFSVQSFQVTPEELNLLKLQTGSITPFSGETAIDSKMLRQLSQAGMAIGRQVPAEVPTVDVRTIPAMSTACDLSQRLGLDALSTIKLSQILTTIIQFNCDPNIMRTLTCTGEQMQLLEKMIEAVVESEFETEMFETLSSLLEKKLKDAPNKIEVLDKLHEFITISDELENLRKPSVLNIIKEIRKHHPKATDKLNQVLSNGGEIFSLAFRHISENRPELIEAVVRTISESTTRVDTEKEACETLHSAIISVVKETSETSVLNLINDKKGSDFKSMILKAVGFARALGLDEVAADLLQVLSDPKSTEALCADKMTWNILRRLTVMKQLAENRPTFTKALHKLESDPELARTDALLRELVRESAALMVVPEEVAPLESSADIPLDIFLQANGLAMEDYLIRSRQRGILLIIKDGLQAVVPREASRAVLTGQVPYSVLDEKGIHHFDPLHVFTALRLPKPVKHIFSMYACKIDDDEIKNDADVNAIINAHSPNPIPEKPQPPKKEYGGEIISSKDIFVAKHDFVPDEEDGINLRKGDKVLVLKTERSDSN